MDVSQYDQIGHQETLVVGEREGKGRQIGKRDKVAGRGIEIVQNRDGAGQEMTVNRSKNIVQQKF